MAQARSIRDLLDDDFQLPINVRGTGSSTLSEKPWTRDFHRVRAYSFYDNEINTLDTVLGDEWDDDEVRIDQPLLYAFPNQPQYISSEGDVTRVYHQQISGPVMAAWTSYPRIIERNQVGPLGSTSFSGTVDCCFTYANCCLLIGELKVPGTITEDWNDLNTVSTTKARLGKELRGYVLTLLKVLDIC
jgi:hypothetical protein